MKRLILTTDDSGAGALKIARLADSVIGFGFNFVWGKLRSSTDLEKLHSSRSAERAPKGPFTLAMHADRDRHARYKQSTLSLTALGEAILSQMDDFSRHNPIRRWWGGTHLTNDKLWRWDAENRSLIVP
jgi:hypothetical protein